MCESENKRKIECNTKKERINIGECVIEYEKDTGKRMIICVRGKTIERV